ncbi:MAG TPA: hypothetical protein VHX61_20815, partial [Rhizomicrobium sp.]|nr:hypothetical protein [Rhizomicrobium sp.]
NADSHNKNSPPQIRPPGRERNPRRPNIRFRAVHKAKNCQYFEKCRLGSAENRNAPTQGQASDVPGEKSGAWIPEDEGETP